jgi:hypothetical protein
MPRASLRPIGLAASSHGRTDHGKTVTKPRLLVQLGLALSEKQIPQVFENLGSGGKCRGFNWTSFLNNLVNQE